MSFFLKNDVVEMQSESLMIEFNKALNIEKAGRK